MDVQAAPKFGGSGLPIPSWRPSDASLFKVNTEARIDLGKNRTGSGAIIRDYRGLVMASCAQNLTMAFPPLLAEAVGILRSICFAWESGLSPCLVESDSQVVVSMINSGVAPISNVGLVISDILDLVNASPFCCVCFAPHKANMVAHCLAKLGLSNVFDSFWMEEVPPCMALVVLGEFPSLL